MASYPTFTFYKTKYGKELLIDVVPLSYAKTYLEQSAVHMLSYYDITLILEGEGTFTINEESQYVKKGEFLFSCPGDVRYWDIHHIKEGYALIFEEEFLLSFLMIRFSFIIFVIFVRIGQRFILYRKKVYLPGYIN